MVKELLYCEAGGELILNRNMLNRIMKEYVPISVANVHVDIVTIDTATFKKEKLLKEIYFIKLSID